MPGSQTASNVVFLSGADIEITVPLSVGLTHYLSQHRMKRLPPIKASDLLQRCCQKLITDEQLEAELRARVAGVGGRLHFLTENPLPQQRSAAKQILVIDEDDQVTLPVSSSPTFILPGDDLAQISGMGSPFRALEVSHYRGLPHPYVSPST